MSCKKLLNITALLYKVYNMKWKIKFQQTVSFERTLEIINTNVLHFLYNYLTLLLRYLVLIDMQMMTTAFVN